MGKVWKPSEGKLFRLTVVIVMMVNVFHPFLWGPDEPREAEIARQVYRSGNFVTPQFCSLPFVEKPPLYYDLVAGMFFLTGGPSPEAARFVSACLGLLMLAAVYGLANRLFGKRCAVISVLLLLGMPQFYRAAHWILLDIGLGAFCTLALALFTFYVCRGKRPGLFPAFYLTLAAAFLTKGVIGIFCIAAVAGTYILIRRRWKLIGEFLLTPSILFFLLPVLLWVLLLYREGGIYYLHEHFINNTVGRFLHKDLTLPGSPILFADVGNDSPWYFYLNRLPSMLGAATLLLPFSLAAAWFHCGFGRIPLLPGGEAPRWKRWLFFLFRDSGGTRPEEREYSLLLLLWLLLPPVLLSFSAIKEVTYVILSYAAAALLIGAWLDRRLPASAAAWTLPAAGILLGAVLCSTVLARFTLAGYWVGMGVVLAAGAGWCLWGFVRRAPVKVVVAVLSLIICGVLIGNTPQLMRRTRQNRKCFLEFSAAVGQEVGERRLAILGGDETLRGSIPFYGDRDVVALAQADILLKAMQRDPELCVLMPKQHWNFVKGEPQFIKILRRKRIHSPDFPRLMDTFYLILPTARGR